MPKDYTDPVLNSEGREQHPAFGVVSVHRITATPGESLFQSDLRHHEYVVIEVHEADRYRDLKHDYEFGMRGAAYDLEDWLGRGPE